MSVRAVLLVAVLLGALGAGAPAGAAGGGCGRPKGAKVVVANAHAAIFTRIVPDAQSPITRELTHGRYWGCVKPGDRVRRLFDTEPFSGDISEGGIFVSTYREVEVGSG